jgi:hypothetical protein
MALKSEVRHGDGLVMIGTEELRKGDEKRCYGMAMKSEVWHSEGKAKKGRA